MVAGFLGLLRDPRWRPVRALGVAYPIAAVAVLATGGRPDYVVPLLLVLLAAGFVRVERWLSGQPSRKRWLAAGLAINGLFTAVIALPVIPLSSVGSTPIPAMSQLVADSVGWPQLGDRITEIYRSLPPSERPSTIVLTANYGEAGAIRRFGPAELPVYSGQNHLFRAGPPPESARTAIMIDLARGTTLFATCTRVGTVDNTYNVDNEEQGHPIHLCRDPREPWSTTWPRFHHYD
jgi:hypothetical protein